MEYEYLFRNDISEYEINEYGKRGWEVFHIEIYYKWFKKHYRYFMRRIDRGHEYSDTVHGRINNSIVFGFDVLRRELYKFRVMFLTKRNTLPDNTND